MHVPSFLDALPKNIVGEIQLVGYAQTHDIVIAIDDHGSRVRPDVWRLDWHALQRLGAVPSLPEWDTDVPPFNVLLNETAIASKHLAIFPRQRTRHCCTRVGRCVCKRAGLAWQKNSRDLALDFFCINTHR